MSSPALPCLEVEYRGVRATIEPALVFGGLEQNKYIWEILFEDENQHDSWHKLGENLYYPDIPVETAKQAALHALNNYRKDYISKLEVQKNWIINKLAELQNL